MWALPWAGAAGTRVGRGIRVMVTQGRGTSSTVEGRVCVCGEAGHGTFVLLEELGRVLQHLVVLAQLQLALAVVEHQRRDQALQLQPALLPRLLLPHRAGGSRLRPPLQSTQRPWEEPQQGRQEVAGLLSP